MGLGIHIFQKDKVFILKFGFIGAGKVGCTLGKFLSENNYNISGYFSKSDKSSEFASQFTNSTQYNSIANLIKNSDIIMITTPDSVIANIISYISDNRINLNGKTLCHCSGSLTSDILRSKNISTLQVCSVHPLYPINNRATSYKTIANAYFTMEGDTEATKLFKNIFEKLKLNYTIIKKEQKAAYHTAATMSSNLMTALYSQAYTLLKSSGFKDKDIPLILSPLMIRNIHNIEENGIEGALTGPVERNDTATIRKHLSCLNGNTCETYKKLSMELIKLANKKHTYRNYTEMKEILQ